MILGGIFAKNTYLGDPASIKVFGRIAPSIHISRSTTVWGQNTLNKLFLVASAKYVALDTGLAKEGVGLLEKL